MRNLKRKYLRGPHTPFLSGSSGELFPEEAPLGRGGSWVFDLQVCVVDAYLFLLNLC